MLLRPLVAKRPSRRPRSASCLSVVAAATTAAAAFPVGNAAIAAAITAAIAAAFRLDFCDSVSSNKRDNTALPAIPAIESETQKSPFQPSESSDLPQTSDASTDEDTPLPRRSHRLRDRREKSTTTMATSKHDAFSVSSCVSTQFAKQ